MIPYELQHITLSQIEIFFRCAEMRNFTKAAESLHITPGMVSKKIASLESALNLTLFAREKNRVVITPDGEALYTAWRPLAETAIRAAEDVKSRRSQSGSISVMLFSATNFERFLVPLLSACTAEMDLSFRINAKEQLDSSLLDNLTEGRTDVVFVPKFMELVLRKREDLESFLALPSPLYAAISPDNPLSRKETLRVEDLKKMELCTAEALIPAYEEMLRALCAEHGFKPKYRMLDIDEFRTNYLCLDADSVLIIDKYYHAFSSNAAEYRELEGTESGLLMVSRREAPPHVRRFVEYAQVFYRELR